MRKPTEFQMRLFHELHSSRTEDFKTFNKRSYRGVWSSIIDKYPESAHFIYELLQNADDAEATEVEITLQYDRLLFKHNGTKHFDVTKEDAEIIGDINSITGIGDSSKTDMQNKIGKFGVGFKAVFQYTDSPEIYDDVFKFRIENYIIPTLLPYDHPERKDGETLFVFPFKDHAKSYQEIRSRLEKLQSPILFLRHLQRIGWRVDNEDGTKGLEMEYSKEILDTFEYNGITLEHYRLVEPIGNTEIILFSQWVEITDSNNKQSSHYINVGYFYDSLRTSAPKLWKITEKERNNQANILPFRKATIIKTQKGEWVAPYINGVTHNVYLPLKDDNKSDYNFIAKEYLEDDMAKKFFDELEIKEPDEIDYISQVILGKFKGQDICIDEDDLTSDFIVLLGYYKKIKDNQDECTSFINQLKTNHFLICGTDALLHQPNQLYFPDDQLLRYFSNEDQCIFFNYEFYNTAVEKFGNDFINKFVSELGVKSYPSICKKKKTNVQQLNARIKNQISTSEYTEYHIEDYELDGFDDFCRSQTLSKETSLYLWNTVLPMLNFKNYESLTIVYRRKWARRHENAYYTSTFKDSLLHQLWLFDVKDKIVSAYDISLEDLAPEYNRNNGLVQFLNIEKREKSILELGGSKEQQEQMDLGKLVKSFAGDELTIDEIRQAIIKEAKAKKKVSANIVNVVSDEWTKTGISDGQEKVSGITQETDSNAMPAIINRDELRRVSLSNMFVHPNCKTECKSQEEHDTSDADEVDAVMQRLIDQEDTHNKIKELREIAHTSEKYSKEWFDALIELEYRGNADPAQDESNKTINISFNSVRKERESECIYVFSNPSRNVPMWMEEIGDIDVKCSFSNQDELTLKFEVANVRNNNLRLKASKAYEAILGKIEWIKCTKASITLKDQIDLMGKVRVAFNRLNLKKGFNIKDNLKGNIRFIFGPPGSCI